MAYSTQEKNAILKKAIKAAKDNKLLYLGDVQAFIPINLKTFYDWKFQESKELKEALEENKINTKIKLRKKMAESDNATLIIALYKLVANDEERKILADNKTIKLEDMPEIKIGIKDA